MQYVATYAALNRMDQPNSERRADISSLPPEVMEIIFDYLTVKDRLRASLTCKRWYQLAFSPKFSQKVCLRMEDSMATFEDIRNYQKYRNARFSTDLTNRNQSAIAEFFQTAPLESFAICGNINSIGSLLDKHLLSLNELLMLDVRANLCGATTEKVVRINHPRLKAVKLDDQSGHVSFEIDCPNLTCLYHSNGMTEDDSRKAVQLAIKLQHQLLSLALFVRGNDQLEMLANANLSNLKNLRLHNGNINSGIERCFNRMVNLIELHLSCQYREDTVGEGLGVLINLSKLTLTTLTLDTEGFENASRNMNKLKDLHLQQCSFTPPAYSWQIVSENFSYLTIDWSGFDPVMLPICRKLKSLQLTTCRIGPDDIFVHMCDSYPQLETLFFNVVSSQGAEVLAKFRSPTSLWHIKQLKHLKELHFVGLHLKDVNWTAFSCLKIEQLRLNCCGLYHDEVAQIFESIGPQLRQLFLEDRRFVRGKVKFSANALR